MKKLSTFGTLVFIAAMETFAASGSSADPHAIPTRTILWQIFNVGVIALGVGFFYRQTINNLFSKRREDYLSLANRAQLQKQAAQAEIAKIEEMLTTLRLTRDQSIVRAHHEAKEQQEMILKEARNQANRIKGDAEESVRLEMGKAIRDFRTALVEGSVDSARKVLKTDVGQSDHLRLQKKFVETVGV